MNSKQRRNQRVFDQTVVIRRRDGELYDQFFDRVKLAKSWLQWTTKRKNWSASRASWDHTTFVFHRGSLASAFALKFAV